MRVAPRHTGPVDGQKMGEYLKANPHPIDRSSIAGRAAVEKRTVHVPDLRPGAHVRDDGRGDYVALLAAGFLLVVDEEPTADGDLR